eukprot:TRINITY_DN1498_c0_g2_i2.p1 TRINITY_DN1498_c0_g2~~TRINITY_DN1498_c0_g2_i2.p1  ORF type:complete len:101 (+),score=2.08 TRINITY_DN1498_c0_g2_i2:250-552(+)
MAMVVCEVVWLDRGGMVVLMEETNTIHRNQTHITGRHSVEHQYHRDTLRWDRGSSGHWSRQACPSILHPKVSACPLPVVVGTVTIKSSSLSRSVIQHYRM